MNSNYGILTFESKKEVVDNWEDVFEGEVFLIQSKNVNIVSRKIQTSYRIIAYCPLEYEALKIAINTILGESELLKIADIRLNAEPETMAKLRHRISNAQQILNNLILEKDKVANLSLYLAELKGSFTLTELEEIYSQFRKIHKQTLREI